MQWLLLVFLVYDTSRLALPPSQESLAQSCPWSYNLGSPKRFPLGVCEGSPKGATDMDKERMAAVSYTHLISRGTMRQTRATNHPSAALRQTIKTAFCPLSRGCSESGF